MRSWKTPTPEQVERAVLQLNRPERAAHFFDKLDNPLWIEPLRSHRAFKTPPPTVRRDNGFSFPIWPAARYLVRMAAHGEPFAGQAIAAVLDADETDNQITHVTYAELAIAAPVEASIPLVRSETKWIEDQPWLFDLLPEKYTELAARLAAGGKQNEAIKLARELLAVRPTDTSDRAQPKARFDAWHYNETLKQLLPSLIAADPMRAIALACDLLNDAAKIQARGASEFDGSFGWRPSIEDTDQNWDLGRIEDLLVDAVRDAVENAIKSDPSSLGPIIEFLKKRKLSIFQRIVLHTVRVFRDKAKALAREELLNISQLDSLDLRHEYSLLLRDSFSELGRDERELILQAIAAGPSRTHWDLSTSEQRAEFEKYSRYWKRDRLSFINTHLDSSWSAVYENLVETLGKPEHPEFSSHHQSWTGPTSPREPDELAKMSVDALVEYLVIWRPLRDFMSASPEGLGRAIQAMASKRSADLLEQQNKLHRLHPVYIRSIIAGIAEGAKDRKDRGTDAAALLLALWAAEQTSLPNQLPGQFTDKDWNWTRRAILDLVTNLMSAKLELDVGLRGEVWKILSILTRDPDPVEPFKDEDPEGYSPSEVALNSVRGSAMHTVVRYALWIRRSQEAQPENAATIGAGFDAMPEVRTLLDWHLDLANEQALAVRSVYGQWFPWLVMLDREWASGAVSSIFPLSEDKRKYFDAAWRSYLSFNPAYRDVGRLLLAQYHHAATHLGEQTKVRIRALRAPEAALGSHVMTLYAFGDLELRSPVLVDFFRKADGKTRDVVLADVGRSLMPPREGESSGEAERVPARVIERFKEFWESRVDAPGHAEEASAFGWWFASGLFDDRWALEHLIAATRAAHAVDALMFGSKRLARLAPSFPEETIRFIHIVIHQHDRPMWTYELRDALRPVLSSAMSAGGNAMTLAIEVTNRLGERGEGDFSDLLRR